MRQKTKNFKMGIFGAGFNPPHLGHLNLLLQVQEKFKFDLIKIIPSHQSPLVRPIKEVSPATRLKLVRKVFKPFCFAEVEDLEIKKEGISYTVYTLNTLQEKYTGDFFLIIGADQLTRFDRWKDFTNIIATTHLVVCSRKGYSLGLDLIPAGLLKHVAQDRAPSRALAPLPLITGQSIYWVQLSDMDISSSQVRARRRRGLSTSHLVPPAVEQWIKKEKPYQASPLKKKKEEDTSSLLKFCAGALLDKKAYKVKAFDLRAFCGPPFDFTLVASGLNPRHTKVLADYLQEQVAKKFARRAQNREGHTRGEWIALDYGNLMVHIFYDYTREYYHLEGLWEKAPALCFSPPYRDRKIL